MARESFRALIPCGKPKTKTNNNGEYIKWKIERGRENGWKIETGCSQWVTSLLTHCI